MPGFIHDTLEPIRSVKFFHEITQENTLTQARDHLSNERSFGTAIKLVLSMCLAGGFFLIKFGTDGNSTADKVLGGVIFGVALALLFIIIKCYFAAADQYKEEELTAVNPIVLMVTALIIGILALALSIAEFFADASSRML